MSQCTIRVWRGLGWLTLALCWTDSGTMGLMARARSSFMMEWWYLSKLVT